MPGRKLTRLTFPQSMIAIYSQRSQNALIWVTGISDLLASMSNLSKDPLNHIFPTRGSRDDAVVRALAFHQCGPGSIPGLDVICGLSLLLVLFSALRGFSPGTPVFPSPQKPTFLNSNSIRNARAFNTWAPGSGDWATTPHAIELK